jgi:nitroimidazol reductase NimA-like FMN-containing flavoprotein (pyridoxamine 5'-phosphate oxidase superfamily)
MRFLDKTERHAVLATVFRGRPYASLVAYALTKDMKGVLFATPKTTRKYKNLIHNKHAAILIDSRKNSARDYMGAESVTIVGKAKSVRRGKRWKDLFTILVRKHPALREFVTSPSTALVLIEAEHCVHVGQFQVISEWKVK